MRAFGTALALFALVAGCGVTDVAGDRIVNFVKARGGEVIREKGRILLVDLSRTRVTDSDLKELANLEPLRQLILSETAIGAAGLKHIATSDKVELLDLERVPGVNDAAMRHVGALRELRHLFLAEDPITDAGLQHLTGLLRLRELSLAATKVSDAGLRHLAGLHELRTLHLEDTAVTDAALQHLAGLKNLELLDLGSTAVTDAGVARFQKAVPKCKIFR